MAKKSIQLFSFPPKVQAQILDQLQKQKVRTEPETPRRKNKYGVAPAEERTSGGVVFASKREMEFYHLIQANVPKGTIVTLQPKFLLQEGFEVDKKKYRAIHYNGDFLLNGTRDAGQEEEPLKFREYVVDVKGMETEAFKIKHKLFAKRYKHQIHKVKNRKQLFELLDSIYGCL